MLTAPGAYDCITARLIEQAGFGAVYMTGAGTAASLGYPDFGLITMSEMADNAGRIAAAVGVPVIADADTGYGNELNVVRTVREYEKRGVAGIHIEDQGFPKKCGHLESKVLISLEEYLAKIRAAVSASISPDFLIIARTDARAVLGFEEAVRRANAALEAGAGMAFVEAPQTLEEVAAVPRLVKGAVPSERRLARQDSGRFVRRCPRHGLQTRDLPALLFTEVIGLCDRLLEEMKRSRRHPTPGTDIPPREAFRRFGADEWDRISEQFHPAPVPGEVRR